MNNCLFTERPITIDGTQVIFHAWKLNNKEEFADYGNKVRVLQDTVGKMLASKEIKPIFIEGQAGSGKSTLAEILKLNGKNVSIIDVSKLKSSGYNVPSSLITDPNTTYIIDECYYGDDQLLPRVEEHVQKGGIAILLIQDIRDLSHKCDGFEMGTKHLHLTTDNLIEIC